jgi:hypothetical protein
MSNQQQYKQDHKIAKILALLIVFTLLYFDGTLTLLNGLAILVWFFGINSIGYVVEAIRGHDHNHDGV